jgi:L-threonylcarbamoyladenylate synthase
MYATQTKDVLYAKRIIEEGRIVAFPTGTSYGLAVNALFGHALQRLRNIKKRPQEKTFSIFMKESVWGTYLDLSQDERDILKRYEHTALTLLVHPKKSLQHLAQDSLVGLRVIDHVVMEQLADAVSVPLTATSANVSGQEACYDPDHIEEALPARDGTTYDLSLGCILDGGKLREGHMSTVAHYTNGKMSIVRQGTLQLSV